MVLLVQVLLHPIVIVADAVEREAVDPPDRLEAHPHAGRVEVRLERRDHRVLREHPIGVELLTADSRPDIDVYPVTA